jgi:hypothetical protein
MEDPRPFNLKAWLLWIAGFVAFFIGGALVTGVTGRVNDFGSALIGGMVVGAVGVAVLRAPIRRPTTDLGVPNPSARRRARVGADARWPPRLDM